MNTDLFIHDFININSDRFQLIHYATDACYCEEKSEEKSYSKRFASFPDQLRSYKSLQREGYGLGQISLF